MTTERFALDSLSDLERIVADPLRFKQRLRIGRKAFKMLKAKDTLYSWWDTFGVATTGAAVAKSSLVATTFFAPTGIMAWLGLATAATPIGWVVAAAAVCGTAYYGASRYFAEGESEFVDQIPKYINTPIDLLGFSLFGLIGGLSVRVVESKGCLDPHSRKVIMDHFCKDWGYDPAFVERALALLEAEREAGSITATAQALAGFQASNPDCNASAMQKELLSFLRDVVEADGVITASEQAALDEIAIAFETQRWVDLGAVGRHAGETAEAVWNAASKAASTATAVMGETAKGLGDRFASVGSRMRSDGK